MVLMTAGIGGYVAPLGDIPDDIFHSERDSILNNLYGAINVMRASIQHWKLTSEETKEEIIKRLGFIPHVILTAS